MIGEIINFFKKNLGAIVLSGIFIFAVIWLGNIISIITSREILDRLSVKVEGLDANNLSSIRVLATLSRAGNTMNLTRVLTGKQNEWNNPSQTFVKKILVGLNSESLKQFSQINITLGDKKFVYTKEQFLAEWRKTDAKSGDWYMSDINGNAGYFVYEAPENVKVKPWNINIPLVSGLLSSINFRGSEYLIQAPLISSVKTFLLLAAVLAVVSLILFFFRRKNSIVINDDETMTRQREFIIFVLSLVATLVSLFILCVIIKFFYKPDTSYILTEAAKVYLDKFLPSFIPKTVERAQFTFSVLLSPFLLLGFYKLLNRYLSKVKDGIIGHLYFIASIAAVLSLFSVAYIGLAVSNFMYTGNNFFLSGVGKYLYSLVLFPIGVYIILLLKKEKYDNLIKNLVYIFSGLLMVVVFFISVININVVSFTDIHSIVGHANPIFYPISQVMAGKTLLVNLSSQYGLYPIFLEPVFKWFGLSILSVTALMGVLLSLSFLFIFLFLRRLVKNNIILLLGFSTIVIYLLDGSANPYPYFQYWPIRTFFPCLLLLLASVYLESKNKIIYFILFIISALSILWNFDSGIMVFISWILVLIYTEALNGDKKIMIKSIVRHLFFGALALTVVFAGFAGYTFLRSGHVPNLVMFFLYQKMFYDGFMMIAMPFPHVWILVMLVFLSGLLLSIKKWLVKDVDWKNSSILLVSILGIGLFSYYEGRSHDATFYLPLYLPLILLTIFADILYSVVVSNPKLYGHTLLFLMIIFFIFSSPFSILYKSGGYYKWSSIGFNSFFQKSETPLTKNINFIKSNTNEGESVVILAEAFDGVYYSESHTRSVLDIPSFTEVFFKREADYAVNFLKCNKTSKVFVYPYSEFYNQFGNELVDIRINQTIKNYYTVVSTSLEDMAFLLNYSKSLDSCK